MHDRQHNYLRRALELALRKSASGRCGPFGAVIECRGEVIGRGWNRVVEDHDPTAHAEMVAIREACAARGTHVLSGCTLYTSCEPCPMCLAAVYWARMDAVVYAADRADAAAAGFDDDHLYREVALPPAHRTIRCVQALRDEGRRVLAAWQANPARKMY